VVLACFSFLPQRTQRATEEKEEKREIRETIFKKRIKRKNIYRMTSLI
jgi:hypothetical protein